MSGWARWCAALLCGFAASGLGEPPAPLGTLVVTQTPRRAGPGAARDRLDQGYPAGSRVVVAAAPWSAPTIRVRVAIGVLMTPGQITLTPTPCPAQSARRHCES